MNIVRLANTIMKLVPMDPDERVQIESEAIKWYYDNVTSKELEQITNPALKILKKYGELWYVKYLTAASYLFIMPYFRDLIHEPREEHYGAND